MATKVTQQEIEYINQVYAACGSYSKTAEITGRAASTVKKYIVKDYKPTDTAVTPSDNIVVPSLDEAIKLLTSMEHLCSLRSFEESEVRKLWKEILV